MPELLLTLDEVRKWVGDFEIAKCQSYSRSVTGCVRDPSTIRACVKGKRPRPYRVEVRFAGGAIDAARCTCPVGTEGKCKHVAAILLAFIEHPKRFVLVESIDANLGARSREEMVALVKLFLRESPELEPLLVRPLPGFAMKPPSSSDYYFQALDAIRATNAHDDWAPHEIAAGLADVVKYAHEFGKPGEPLLEVYVAIAQALREELGAAQAAEVTAELPATIREHLHGGEPGADEIVPPF